MWEVATDPVTLGERRFADTLSRVLVWVSRVTVTTRKVARAVETADGTCVFGVTAFLFTLLLLDKVGEVITALIFADPIADVFGQWVAVKERRK